MSGDTSVIGIRLALEGADQVQAGANKAAAGLDKIGQAGQRAQISAGQMQQAFSQLPNQLQDFFIQVQGGQSVLTAFAQQGSQVGASFGGIGNAVRAIAGAISPTMLAIGGAAVTVGVLAKAYNDGAGEAQAYARALILSGNAAGTTAAQMQAMAAAQGKVVGTQAQAADALAQLAATGRVAGTQLSTAAEAAVRFARVGGDVGEVVKKFSDLGKEPLAAIKRLNDNENFLTESVYKQVKALTEQGRVTEAAKVAQDAYASALTDRSGQMLGTLGTIERSWLNIKEAAGKAWDSMLGVGRQTTLAEQIAQLEKDRARLQGAAQGTELGGFRQWWRDVTGERSFSNQAKDLEGLIARLKESEQMSAKVASAEAARAAAMKATIKADEDAAKAKAKLNAEAEREAAALEKAIGLSGSYYKGLAELVTLRAKGKLTEEQYVEAIGKLINAQPKVREQVQAETEARREAEKVLDEQAKAYQRGLEAQYRSIERVDEQIQKLKDENGALLLSASSNISLAAAVEMLTAARLTEQRVKADAKGDYLTAAALQAEIDKRKELAGLINTKDAREAAKKSAEEAAREWQRASGEIERTITDSLMRGFESGKGFASSLRDTVVNMFKTMVLRPVVSAIVSPVAGALAGGLGFSAAASAAGAAGGAGGFGALSAAGAASAMYPLLSNFGLAAQNFFTNAGTSLFNMGAESAGNFLIGNAGNLGYIANSLGTGLGYLSSIKNLADGKYGAGLLGGAGAYFGGPIGALIGGSIGGALDKLFGGAGTNHAGAGYVSNGLTGQNVSNGGYGLSYSYGDSVGRYYSQGISDALKGITTGSASLLNDLSKSFGGAGGYQVGAYFASDNNRESQGSRSVLLNGQTLSEWSGKGLAADAKTGLEQLTNALAGDLRAAISTIDLPGWAREQFAALASDATIDQLAQTVQAINANKAALVSLGEVFPMLARLSDDALSGLVKAAGGVQALSQSASAYYENFYSDTEKTARATDQVRTAIESLGLAMPTTREAYRALVEAQDLTTEAGQKQYAALLQLSPAFAALVPATVSLGTAAQTAAETVDRAAEQMAEAGRRALADLASQRGSLEVELLRAQGDTVGALRRQRDQDIARITTGLSAQDAAAAVAAYDLNAALQQQIDQTYAASRAAQDAAAAETDRAAAAQRSAAELAAAEAQRVQAVSNEREALEVAMLRATGDTAALRAKELAALDASNRPLQQRLYDLADEAERQRQLQQAAQEQARAQDQAASDAARAAEQQARAAEQLREAWSNVGNTLAEEAARIRGLGQSASTQTVSAALARFAVATGQARAGDIDAARSLPELSRAALDLMATTATSTLQLARARAQIAASLEQTAAITGQGGAAASSAPDLSAVLSQVAAAAPITAAPTPASTAGSVATSAAGLADQVRSLTAQVAALQDAASRTATATERTRDLLNNVTEGGRAVLTEAYVP